MAKDLIIGVVDNYDWDKIKYWANSIKKSGFDGYKAMIVFNMDKDTVKKLTDEGFMTIGVNQYDDENGFTYVNNTRSIMVDRFFYIYNFLKMLDPSNEVDRVIMTDVRDVVFQKNPSKWMDEFFLPQFNLIVGSENLRYEDEPWGRNNLIKSFGEYFYDNLKDKTINCAGVVAGTIEDIKDLSLNIWLMTRMMNTHVDGGGGPDQAALNIMLDMVTHRYTTMFTDPTDSWVVHAGTSIDAVRAGSGGIGQAYLQNPDIELPFVNNIDFSVKDDMICANDKSLTVVHQWDRVPAWKELVEKNYGE